MKFKGLWILLLLITSITLTYYQVNQIQKAHQVEETPLIVLTRDLKPGDLVEKDDLTLKYFPSLFNSQHYVQCESQLLGKVSTKEVKSMTVVQKQWFTDNPFEVYEDKLVSTAIKLAPEAALCWSFYENEWVSLVHVWEDSVVYLGQVLVKGIYDAHVQKDHLPQYVLVAGEEELILEIILRREEGRMELIQ